MAATTTASMRVASEAESALFGSISRAEERANNAARILRTALDDIELSQRSRKQHSPLAFSDSDSGYMSNDSAVDAADSQAHTKALSQTQAHAEAHPTEPEPSTVSDAHTPPRRRASNDDAQAMVIASLRSQVQDLFSQVTALNNKLVKSYDRVSDLEDDLHISSQNLRNCTIKVSQLELECTQHLSALNTGLLVEKEQVTAELTRLMEKATDEAARRGQAESARMEIEKDLDDLSAGLFGQANTMVAEARFERARSERKAEDAERALKETEEVIGLMQQQMQALQVEKEASERRLGEMEVTMGKGKWVERAPSPAPAQTLRLLSSHLPYQEFLFFVAHLRSLRLSTPQAPAMSTLLPLPFLARLLTEDTCVALSLPCILFFFFPYG